MTDLTRNLSQGRIVTLVAIALLVVFAATLPGFATADNILSLLQSVSIIGILGLGRIGHAVAKRAEAFGLEIAYHGRRRQDGVAYAYHDSPAALAEACDILLVATPGGGETRHIVDARLLKALGPSGYLVNIGRGSAVDEAALVAALEAGTIAGAGLDVYEDEPRVHPGLIPLQNAVLLPHLASGSVPTRTAMGQAMFDNLDAWFETGKPLTPIAELS